MRVTSGGNVLIGKTTQTNTACKLDVNGSARINEVVVNSTGADFVFENTYKLPSLADALSAENDKLRAQLKSIQDNNK